MLDRVRIGFTQFICLLNFNFYRTNNIFMNSSIRQLGRENAKYLEYLALDNTKFTQRPNTLICFCNLFEG